MWSAKTKVGRHNQAELSGGIKGMMKRLLVLIVVLSLLVITGSLVTADGQTRRRKSKFGRKARTVAIIGGGAAVGALVAGKKGAAIGAGGTGLYAFNRRAARRHFKGRTRTAGTVLSGTALGAGVGAAAGGKQAAAIGAGAGAAGSYLYTRRKRHRRRY
jgi:Na+/H+ antiporter NhaC